MVSVHLCTCMWLVPLLLNVCQCRPVANPDPGVVRVLRSRQVPLSATLLAAALHPPAVGTFTMPGVPRRELVKRQSMQEREHQVMDRDYFGWLDFGKRQTLENDDAVFLRDYES